MIKIASLTSILMLSVVLVQAQSTKKEFKQLLRFFEDRYSSLTSTGTEAEKKLIDQMTITVMRVKGTFWGDTTYYVKYVRSGGSLYRQRLYHFKFDGQKITSELAVFAKDSLFVDFYQSAEKIKNLTQADLKPSLNCKYLK